MPPHSAVTAEQARLYGEAERLGEEFCARLTAGDDADGDLFIRRREEILGRIQSLGGRIPGQPEALEHDARARQSAGAIRRILELDRRIVELLQARMAGIGRELAEISRGRGSLASYRGPAPISPVFLDRRG